MEGSAPQQLLSCSWCAKCTTATEAEQRIFHTGRCPCGGPLKTYEPNRIHDRPNF